MDREPTLSIASVISLTLQVLRNNALLLAVLGLLTTTLPGLAFDWLVTPGLSDRACSMLAGVLGQFTEAALFPAVVHVALVSQGGPRATLGSSLAAAGRVYVPMLGLAFVTTLGIVLGLFLLVVPGVYLFLRWLMAGPVRAAEGGTNSNALVRSAVLMQGNYWRCVALMLIYGAGAGLVAALEYGLMGSGTGLWSTVVSNVLFGAHNVVVFVITAAIYHELRRVKEGGAPAALAEVFS